jgi:MraZ protein
VGKGGSTSVIMIFRGRYEYTIDPKGRVNVPSRFREQIQDNGQESLIVTNFNGCLYIFPPDEWSRIEDRLSKQVSSVDTKLNTFVRFFLGAAMEVAPDKQGRILIPPSLRSYAGLDKNVVIIGMPNRIELWSQERWETEVGRFERDMVEDAELAREIRSLGI